MKICFKCQRWKPLSDFYRHPMMADGRLGKCKDCCCADVKLNRNQNAEYYRQYERERNATKARVEAREAYAKSDRGKLICARAKARWLSHNQIKRECHVILGNAVRDGRILKQPCEICGSQVRIHGHHDDYDLPLVVRWLCPKHHRDVHWAQKAA